MQLERAVQLDLHRILQANDFPGIGATEPIVRLLQLPSVLHADEKAHPGIFLLDPDLGAQPGMRVK